MSGTSIIVRTIGFITLSCGWYFDVWWIGIPLALWYIYQYRAYELILLGVLIDIEFLVLYNIPWYTIGFTALFVVGEWLKPLIRRTSPVQL